LLGFEGVVFFIVIVAGEPFHLCPLLFQGVLQFGVAAGCPRPLAPAATGALFWGLVGSLGSRVTSSWGQQEAGIGGDFEEGAFGVDSGGVVVDEHGWFSFGCWRANQLEHGVGAEVGGRTAILLHPTPALERAHLALIEGEAGRGGAGLRRG
jgi:hypothetical protein